MTGDFPDRDEWTDRPLHHDPEYDESFDPDAADEAMGAAEWEDLGATDLLSPDELAEITKSGEIQ